jgi:Anti-sigma factor NepR
MPAINLARRTPADKAHLLALAERWIRPLDRLDYMIRRWAIPVPLEVNRSAAASMLSNGLLSEVQAAIGRYLRAEYDLAQPIPDRLVDLLRQLEQRGGVLRARPGVVLA